MPSPRPELLRTCLAGAAALLLLNACSPPLAPPPPSRSPSDITAPPPAEPAPAPGGGLFGPGGIFGPRLPVTPEEVAASQLQEMAEALSEQLSGTPVEVQRAEPDQLRIAVPANFCFDAGRSIVKQPLAAVLDRVAAQLKTKTSLRLSVAGPADATSNNVLLATDRAAATRDYLIARGVPAARFNVQERAATSGVEIHVMPRKNLRG